MNERRHFQHLHAQRITGAVTALVVLHSSLDRPTAARPQGREHLFRDDRVFFDEASPIVVERSGRQQDLCGDARHADVVQQGGHDGEPATDGSIPHHREANGPAPAPP